jgi:ABC-2 type transport system permease protein
MAAISFLIGTCAIPLQSILSLIRAKYWLIEMLSGLLIPIAFFPAPLRAVSRWLPFEHIAYTPLQIYLGKLTVTEALAAITVSWAWVALLIWAGHVWWNYAMRKITIHGG